MIRYSRAQLRAAVDAGRLGDPKAAEYLTDMLVARQRATAKYWFERASALDGFAFENGELCFDDLMRVHALSMAATTYTLAVFDGRGTQRTQHAPLFAKAARTCTSVTLEDYSIVRITTKRLGRATDIYVHVAGAHGQPRVIGIYRR